MALVETILSFADGTVASVVASYILAGFLGAGTIGLVLRRRRVFQIFAAYVVGFAALFAVLLALAPVDATLFSQATIGGLALPSNVRVWTPFVSIPGGIAFI